MHNTPSTNRTVSPLFGLHGLIGAAAALTTIALGACDGGSGKPAPVESQVVYSDAFTIDTTWASMQGPYRVTLPPGVTRVRVQIGTGTESRTLIVGLEPGQTRDVSLAR